MDIDQQLWILLKAAFAILTLNILCTTGTCTWPSYFARSTWEDSSKGHTVFTTNEVTGWTFQVQNGPTLGTWACHSTDWLDSDGYLVLRTTDVFAPFGTEFYGYLCLKLVRITDQSYRYYQYNPEQPQLYYERVFVHANSSLNDKTFLCLETATSYRPSDSEYKVLILSGSSASAKIQCPYVFLGTYDYTYTDVSGSVTCNASSDVMDICTDTTEIAFNYTTCSTKIAYSASDTVWCVDTVKFGGNNYVTLYNGNDVSVDESTTYRFSCMAVSGDKASVSITPNSCKKDQIPSVIPTNLQTGSTEGALVQLSELESCESCPSLTAPEGGYVSYTTDGAVTSANYECGALYSLTGDAIRICQDDYTWSSDPPTCTCIFPSPPGNGSVTQSTDGSMVTHSCNVGFVLNGNENRTCQSASNSWSGSDPTCEPCDNFSLIAGLMWMLTIDGTTSRADFTCSTNYTLVGSTVSTCLTTGRWSTSVPDCVLCDSITSPTSGTAVFSTDGYFSSVSFTCVSGYHLVGETSLTCGESGNWNGSSPLCDLKILSEEPAVSSEIAIGIGTAVGVGLIVTIIIVITVVILKRSCPNYIQPTPPALP